MQPAFGVIGLGRMAQALVVPLLERGRIPADQLLAVVGGSGSVSNDVGAFQLASVWLALMILPLSRSGRLRSSCLR